MNSETVVYCVVALLLGMLLANMLKSICDCKVVEGQECSRDDDCNVPGWPHCYRARCEPDANCWSFPKGLLDCDPILDLSGGK